MKWLLKHQITTPVKKLLHMDASLVTVDVDVDIYEAADMMMDKKVHHLIVIERESGQLKGIISAFNIATHMMMKSGSEERKWPFPEKYLQEIAAAEQPHNYTA